MSTVCYSQLFLVLIGKPGNDFENVEFSSSYSDHGETIDKITHPYSILKRTVPVNMDFSSPWCPKQLLNSKYTGKSELPGDEYTGESPPHKLPDVNTPGTGDSITIRIAPRTLN